MRSYPIWCEVNTDTKKNANFGARGGFDIDIRVGTGPSNSHLFANIVLENGEDGFVLYVDRKPVKGAILLHDTLLPVQREGRHEYDDTW